jgi:hypothetical protein
VSGWVPAAAVASLFVLGLAPTPVLAETAYGVTTSNQLIVFDTGSPSTVNATVPITGLQGGEAVVGIDVRPATGQLYALGGTGRVYVLNPVTGVARQPGAGTRASLSGAAFGFDFNPTVDRIRVVSDAEQNLRLNPDTGGIAAADTNLAPAGNVVAVAYTNNFAGATQTTLFAIDSGSDQLVIQGGVNGMPSPNAGAITPIGPLGVDTSELVGFDITANDGLAFASLTVGGASSLYRINLTTGAATLVGPIGSGTQLRGVAVLSRGVTLYGVTTTNQLVRFHSALPATIVATAAVSGLQAGENVLGIDFRPATGELYALGSTSRLYRIDTATARATQVGPGPFTPALSGAEFGVDFNPTVDRLRIVSDTGQNFRLNPDTGAVAGTDTALNPPGSALVGSAYTNNVDGATVTTLFGIDAAGDRLVRQGGVNGTPSPNAGLLTAVGPLGVDAGPATGFDISPLDGVAFAAFGNGGGSSLFTVDLVSGTARPIAPIGAAAPIRALAAQPTDFHTAEGSTGSFFDTDLLVANPTAVPAPITVTYFTEAGDVVTSTQTVAARARQTISVDGVPGVGATAFSAVVSSHLGLPIAVERTMRWDPTGYGMHTETAAPGLARTWNFAEGSQGFFDTFLLLANPAPVTNTANVRFLLENGTVVPRSYTLGPQSRLTVYAGAIPELVNQSFGMVVTFTIAGAAERAMYFGTPTFNAGQESRGVLQPSTSWFLAEGATGSFFTTFMLLMNPGNTPANVTMNYFREGGGQVTKVKTLAANSRLTVNIGLEDPSLAATAVATQVNSDVPIVVERAQYWPGPPSQWYEAHNSFGVVGTATRWALAEGRVGGSNAFQTFVLLANPGSTAANVTLTFLRTTGAPIVKSVLVAPSARLTVTTGAGSMVPELVDENFGTLVTSDQPIFVERAMYSNANGVLFAAGSNATATAIP